MTGATIIYDRHTLYKKLSDFQLGADASRRLYKDNHLKCNHCVLDLEVFNGDILLAGHVPNNALQQEISERLSDLSGYRRLFIQVSIQRDAGDTIKDSWITTKIRSGILADADINPKLFKVMTADQIVYLMGDVDPAQAKKVVMISRKTTGVKRVVTLLRYYHLTDKSF